MELGEVPKFLKSPGAGQRMDEMRLIRRASAPWIFSAMQKEMESRKAGVNVRIVFPGSVGNPPVCAVCSGVPNGPMLSAERRYRTAMLRVGNHFTFSWP